MSQQLTMEKALGIEGKKRAASHSSPYLDMARAYASKFCAEHRGADKYRKALERYPEYRPEDAITSEDIREGVGILTVSRHGSQWKDRYKNNYMGHVFSNGEYIRTPATWTTATKGAHARVVFIWIRKTMI